MGPEQELQQRGQLGSLKHTPSPVETDGKGSVLVGLSPVEGAGRLGKLEGHTSEAS